MPDVADRPPFEPVPVTLENEHARLEPLDIRHADDLVACDKADPAINRYSPRPLLKTRILAVEWIAQAIAAAGRGTDVPFAIVRVADGKCVGSTRYLTISRCDRSLEIGYTFLAPEARRTAINSACKRMLLGHAFDTLGANRVQLKTDLRNVTSQRAIERLGAVREGVLRRHMLVHEGYYRDTVMYSIIDSEWPAVRDRLDALLARGAG